jgi:hypothetical protein
MCACESGALQADNITFGIAGARSWAMPGKQSKNKAAKKQAIADQALADLQAWMHQLKNGRAPQRFPAVHPA